ncbi:MAG: aminopeptidase P family protein [Phycisphaerales bacterium]|nr:aminopeptidase P family protein [Phycisphaerales bacterium]
MPRHYADRLARLRRAIEKAGVDALLVTNAHDIRYLTPFSGEDSYAIVTARQFVLISDSRFAEEIEPLGAWLDIALRKGPIADKVGEVAGDLKIDRLGVQSEHVTLATRRALAKAVGARKIVETSGLFSQLRVIKDEVELGLIRKAIRCQQQALEATLASLKIGQSEAEIAARLEYEMKQRGAEGSAFGTNVSAKANSSKPHYRPSSRAKLTRGSTLLIDWGAKVEGYCSDMTRAWGVGAMPKKIQAIYPIVLEAQLAAIDAIRGGALCREVDAAARRIIDGAGYGDYYGHGLGHGIGLDVHEAPSMSPRSGAKDRLEPGMVVTVEPGIYLPGVGGVRIEDDVLVTDKGCRVLSDWPKSPESAKVL